jgi:ferric iron reductase protein FhuF
MFETMLQPLMDNEKEYLETNFRIVVQKEFEENMVSLASLLDEDFLNDYLSQLKVELKADSLFAAGSQLMKKLGFLLAVPTLYSLSVYHKCLPIQLENCFLVPAHNNGKWIPNMFIKDLAVMQMNGKNREEERNFYVKNLFNTMQTLIQSISNVAKVPKPILWENVAIYIYWLYEEKMKTEIGSGEFKQAIGDFNYLLQEASVETYQETFNPIARFYSVKRDVEGIEEPIRIRRTCCFYYETGEDRDFCSTCPKSKVNQEACRATKRKLLNQMNVVK